MCVRNCVRRFVLFVLQFSLAASALSFGFSQAASAQNIFPGTATQARSVYDWSGYYAGGHFGYGWRPTHSSVRVNVVSGSSLPAWSHTAEGWLGGLQIGRNYLLGPHVLVGVEADISFSNIFDNLYPPFQTPPNAARVERSVRWFGTARGRLGWINNNILIYGTGGLAEINWSLKRTQLVTTVNAATPGTIESTSFWNFGWTVGGGVEAAVNQRWTIKAEYLYLQSFNDTTWTWPLAQIMATRDLRLHVARIGMNYRF
jgi:opacity protein-like surface antigen